MTCELCSRDLALTFHHLIPRTLHSRKWFKKNFTKEELQSGIDVCRDCHNAIHRFIPEKVLGKDFHSLEKLRSHVQLTKFVKWVSKRSGSHATKLPHGRKGRR